MGYKLTLAAVLLAGTAHADPSFGPYPEETFMTCGAATSTVAVAIQHGGWNVGGSYNDNWNVKQACDIMTAIGVTGYPFNYRLASTPAQGWPAQWQDAQTMVRYLRAHGYAKVGLMGLSAGAYDTVGVVVSRGIMDWAATDPLNETSQNGKFRAEPDFAIAVSPFWNLTDPKLSRIAVNKMTDQIAPGLAYQTQRTIASPINRIQGSMVPLFVVHGTNDEIIPVAQSQDAEIALQGAGGTTQFLYTTGKHVFGGYSTSGLAQVKSAIATFITVQVAK